MEPRKKLSRGPTPVLLNYSSAFKVQEPGKLYSQVPVHPAQNHESLSHLFKSYILPKPQDAGWSKDAIDDSKFQRSEGESMSRVSSFSVLHSQIVYPSAKTSKRILEANKKVYERMRNMLENMENKNYNLALSACKLQKQKLNYFNCRVRIADTDYKSIRLICKLIAELESNISKQLPSTNVLPTIANESSGPAKKESTKIINKVR